MQVVFTDGKFHSEMCCSRKTSVSSSRTCGLLVELDIRVWKSSTNGGVGLKIVGLEREESMLEAAYLKCADLSDTERGGFVALIAVTARNCFLGLRVADPRSANESSRCDAGGTQHASPSHHMCLCTADLILHRTPLAVRRRQRSFPLQPLFSQSSRSSCRNL